MSKFKMYAGKIPFGTDGNPMTYDWNYGGIDWMMNAWRSLH